MQVGQVVRVVGYDENRKEDSTEPLVDGAVGTVVDVNERTQLVEVDLGFPVESGDLSMAHWLFFPEELENA